MDTVESVTLLHNHAIWRNVALPIGSPPPLWKRRTPAGSA